MDRRRAAGVLLALAACVAHATAAPTASNHTSLDIYDGAPDGCYYNFQHYGEGDRIMTNEPCLNCTCHNRMLMCYLRVCPFTKPIGQDCTIEKRADQCCPIVTCPDVPVDLLTSTTTSPAEYGATGLGKLDKYGCSIHGKYFSEGSKVPPTPNKPCEHCYCIRNMTTCVMQECTLHVDGCTPIYHKDVCCPVRYSCDHPEDEMPLLDDLSTTVRPTPGFLLTTTTLSPVTQMSQDCLYENQIIPDGALIKTEKACDHCYCMKGDIVCVVQECGTPMENEGKNCTALAPREGVCCPDTYICEGDEPTTGIYDGLDYTTESEQEIQSTSVKTRRPGSEGSGYRNEPDDIPNTEPPTFESETEGSGDELATVRPTVVTEALPDSHKIEIPDTISPSSEEPHEFITVTTNETPVFDMKDVTTGSDKHEDISESEQYVPSSTINNISQQSYDTTTKSQDEDIGSGEEDIITEHEIVSTSSALPVFEEISPMVTSELYITTTASEKQDDYESHVKETTAAVPTIDEHRTNLPKEQSITTEYSDIEITTEPRVDINRKIDSTTVTEEAPDTEKTTSSSLIMQDNEKLTTISEEKNKMDVSYETDTPKTYEPEQYSTATTSTLDSEDEITTTDPQYVVSDSMEGTGADFDPHHQISITASTPLLEEIENDTDDQVNISDESSSNKYKTSTASSNMPTEETMKDRLKPDLSDEIIPTDILTTESVFEIDDVTSTEPQRRQETELKPGLEPQQYVPSTSIPTFEDENQKTTSDFINISTPQKDHDTEFEHSTESQFVPTTSVPIFDKKTTPSEFEYSSEPHKTQETDVKDSSEPAAATEDYEVKKTTQSGYITTIQPQISQETHMEESSEPPYLAPTSSAPASDDEFKRTIPSESSTTFKPQETDFDESSESQQHSHTTISSLTEEEIKNTKPSEPITTSATEKGQEVDANENVAPQQYATTTNAPVFDVEEVKRTSPSVIITTLESLNSPEKDMTTSYPAIDDEIKKVTLPDFIKVSEPQRGEDADIEETSEHEPLSPTSTASVLEDDSQKTTSLDDNVTNIALVDIDYQKASSTTTIGQSDITTIEPDKGLNTIPSGSVKEEITESPEVEKYYDVDKTEESTTEHENKFSDEVIPITNATTSIPDSSASREDQFTLSTESTVKESVDSVATHGLVELTTVPDVVEEKSTLANDLPLSTKSPVTENQEIGTSPVPSDHDITTQTAESEVPEVTLTYGSSTLSIESQDSTSEKHESITDSPLATSPEPTTANLEENEIINEPRIPGEGDCLLNGVTYRNESAVPSTNKCQSGCKCSSSIIKCDPILCSPPPEYMENCQTTYDAPDSCCPTYVCDHKTETMPPQSHSQMSGTEAPVESPVKCNGDECVLSEDKNKPEELPVSCESGSCSSQDEAIPHPHQVPEQPTKDRHEECTGDNCTSPESSDQLCSEDNGCQVSPVKPCEGTECEVTSDTIPQHKPPCEDGEKCDTPTKDCSAGKCDSEAETFDKKPHEKECTNKEECEDSQDDIIKECTEKSCKRKDDSTSEQQPPIMCSGKECKSPESIPAVEYTTAASTETSQKEKEFEMQTKTTGKLDVTEKIETSTELPLTDSDRTERPVGEFDVTKQPSTLLDISINESATSTESPLSEITKVNDVEEATDTPLYQPDMYSTNKHDDDVKETEDNIYSSTVAPKESETEPFKNLDKVTKSPEKEVHEDAATTQSDTLFTIPTKTNPIESLDAITPTVTEGSTTENAFTTTIVPAEGNEIRPQEITISITGSKDEDTTTKISTSDSEPHEVTKIPQGSEDEGVTTKAPSEINTTPSKVYEMDSHEASISPGVTLSEEMTTQTADEIRSETNSPSDTDRKEITRVPEEPPIKGTIPESTTELSIDKLTTHSVVETSMDSTKTYDSSEKEITESPNIIQDSEITTLLITENTSQTFRPLVMDETVTTQTPIESEEITTNLAEKLSTETVDSDTTKQSDITDPSIDIEEQKVTKSPDVIQELPYETDTKPSIQETEKEVTTSIINEDTGTESSKLDESKSSDTTKSPDASIGENTTTMVTKETDTKPGLQEVTQSTELESTTLSDKTTPISIEDEHTVPTVSHSLEISTTSQYDSVFELTTPSISEIDSKSTKPEGTDVNEITTGIREQSQTTESATVESIDKTIITTSISPVLIEKDVIVTSEEPQDIMTVSPLELLTRPVDENETTETIVDELTKEPVLTSDDKVQETMKTKVPDLLQTDKDQPEVTTSIPTGFVNVSYEKNTELPEPTAESPQEKLPSETSDKITDIPQITEIATTELTMTHTELQTPISTIVENENQTDKSIIREQDFSSTEPNLDTVEKDELETKVPSTDRSVTSPQISEDKSTVTEATITQYPDTDSMPTESEEETYTKMPSYGSSETADPQTSHTPGQNVDEETKELTTVVISASTTEPSKIFTNIPTESYSTPSLYTDTQTVTTQKEYSGTDVTEQTKVESSSSKDTLDQETDTASEIPFVHELITKEQPQTDIHILSTESTVESDHTETSDKKIATKRPEITVTENIEFITEAGEMITKETETKTPPEQDEVETSQPSTTESVNQITEAQEQGDIESDTSKLDIKDSEKIPSVLGTTEAPEAFEASTQLLDIVTVEDSEKLPPVSEVPSTPKNELHEITTSKTEDETLVDEDNTKIPDLQTVEIVTEPQPSPIDTATMKQETATESVTYKTEKPDLSTVSTREESEKSTPLSVFVEESSVAPEQSMSTSIEPQVLEEEQLATTIVSEMDRTSTSSSPAVEQQTEKLITPTETPLEPEPSPETLAPEEEKQTTSKAEDTSTAAPVSDKFTKPVYKPTKAPVTEQPRPIPTQEQPTDDFLPSDEESSIPSSGTSAYGTDSDYPEEDQAFGPGTCRYGGKVYVSAQQIPRDDPCDFCFCFRSDIICLQQSCPPPIHGCHEEPISGFCCPRYECPVSMATTVNVTTTTTTTTTTLPPHFPVHSYKGSAQKRGCLIKGHTYKVGEVVRASSGPCLHCTCGGDGQMKCDPKQCTPEPMLRQMIAAAVSAKRRR